MTVVQANNFYEWRSNNDKATCEECGKEMQVPETDDINRAMKEPYWIEENPNTYMGGHFNKFRSYCESCYSEKMSKQQEEVRE